jgi:hypothetical protein
VVRLETSPSYVVKNLKKIDILEKNRKKSKKIGQNLKKIGQNLDKI